MKIINLQGLTTGERLAYLEEICQEIYNHLYDDYIWVTNANYVSDTYNYKMESLICFSDKDEVKSGQIVYFPDDGKVSIINQINSEEETFTINNTFTIKGDKGETGLEALQTTQILERDSRPTTNATFTLNEGLCNRTPVSGDIFICVIKGTGNSLGQSWLATCTVLDEGGFKGQIKSFVQTTGARGEGLVKRYMHAIYINAPNDDIYVWFYIICSYKNAFKDLQTLKTIYNREIIGNIPASGAAIDAKQQLRYVGSFLFNSNNNDGFDVGLEDIPPMFLSATKGNYIITDTVIDLGV